MLAASLLKALLVLLLVIPVTLFTSGLGLAFMTSVKPYVRPLGSTYSITPLLSVGDKVPETDNPSAIYQMVGIPDGLAAHGNPDETISIYMNHELTNTAVSEPFVGDPKNRGAFVSKYVLSPRAEILSGDRAYDWVYYEDVLVGPAAQADNATPAFGRFCTGTMSGPEDGFDRYIYFTNEEAEGTGTFDGMGGLSVAIFDDELHTLPRLGRFSKENTVPMPGMGDLTIIMSLEDGPTTPDSQLYMYVGRKNRSAEDPMARNGLNNGVLYVFAPANPEQYQTEKDFTDGTVVGQWIEVPSSETMTEGQLEAFSDSVGALGFVRIEDGAFSKTNSHDFFFVTTGGNKESKNELEDWPRSRLWTILWSHTETGEGVSPLSPLL